MKNDSEESRRIWEKVRRVAAEAPEWTKGWIDRQAEEHVEKIIEERRQADDEG